MFIRLTALLLASSTLAAPARAEDGFLNAWGPFGRKNAETVMKPLAEVDVSQVPAWQSLEEFTDVFERVRDARYLQAKRNSDFARRIPWLYPDNGCHTRAALARRLVEDQWGYRVAKVFLFGDLKLTTPYHPRGKVSFGWHVAIAGRVDDTVYVIDPSVEASRPLALTEWQTRLTGKPERTRFAVCPSYAYAALTECVNAGPGEEKHVERDLQKFLDEEWTRLKRLKRNPEQELGDHPPWFN